MDDHDLVTYESLDETRGVTLHYQSTWADPREIVHFGYDDVNPNIFSPPSRLKVVARLTVTVDGVERVVPGLANPGQFGLRGGEHFWSIPAGGGPLDAALQVDLRDQPTGLYPYRLAAGLEGFTGSRFVGSLDTINDQLVHVNSIASPFGSGWNIAGLQQLLVGPDGSVLIVDGGGTTQLFRKPAGGFIPPPGDFSTLEKLPDGTFRRTTKDQMVYQFDAANLLSTVTDRNGNTTRYDYDAAGNVMKITDPVGLETSFAYSGGRAASITDPAGRVTQLQYDAAGNLMRIIDPDGTSRTWEYDANHHMTASIDKRGNRGQDFYDQFGRATQAIRPNGSMITVTPGQVQGLFPPSATIDPASAPAAFRSASGDAVYTDRNGNVIRTVLDAAGQEVSSTDSIGALPIVERNDQNLVTKSADARGHETIFTYDTRGNFTSISDEISSTTLLDDTFDAERGGVGLLNYTGFANWNVTDGSVDLVGNGFFATVPGHGLFVDLDGATNNAGRMESKTTFALDPGTYELAFDLAGNPNSIPANTVTVQLGSVFNESFTLGNTEPFRTIRRTITVTNSTVGKLIFDHAGGDNFGIVLDNVSLVRTNGKRFTYDPTFSQLTGETDELGHQTLYDIDPANGNVRSMTEVVGVVGGADDVVTQFTYTPRGLVDTITDPLGRVTDFDYDPLGRLTQMTFAQGTSDAGVRHNEYDAAGNQTELIDENGHRTEYEYDLLNRLTRVVEADPDGMAGPLTSPVTTLVYDTAGNITRLTDARGNVTQYEYDSLDRQTKKIDPNSGEMRYGYDSNDNLTSITDELGHVTEYRYDARDRVIETIDPDNGSTRFEYDLDDNNTAIIDSVGNRTEFAYDARSRTTRETQSGVSSSVIYSNDFETAAGPEWSIDRTDRTPAGNRGFLGQFANETETLTLNSLAPHSEVTVSFDLYLIGSWDGNQVTFSGFTVGPDIWDLSVAGGPTLLHTTFTNFANGSPGPCGPDQGPNFRQAYPAAFPGGNNTGMTGSVEQKSLGYYLDDIMKFVSTTPTCDPRSSVYHLSFTFPHTGSNLALDFSAMTTIITPSPFQDEPWGLDNVQVTIRSVDPTTQYAYDPADNLAQMTDRNNRVTQFAYDDLDRLTTETWVGGGNVIQYGYDKSSNLTSAMDSFSSLAFTHDARDRVRTVDNAGTPNVPNVVLTYSYDAAGNVLSMADAIGGSPAGLNSYAYDALDRMTQFTQSRATGSASAISDKRVDFTYNPLGQFASINRFSDLAAMQPVVHSTFQYDTLNRLTAITHANPANPTPLDFFNLTYDAASRITSITDIDGLTNYSYDDRDELTAANHADPANPDENYNYDANGNRISSHLHGTGYVTDLHNRVTSDGTFNYAYDPDGNMTLRTEIATGATREFQWDFRNRPTAVIDRDAMSVETQRVEFTYDAFNRRTSKTVTPAGSSTLTHFVYDRDNVLLEFVDPDASGPQPSTLNSRLLHGPTVDQILAQEDGVGSVLWHLADHLGTVDDLVDNSGVVASHLTYDSYGKVVTESNATVDTRYLFTGREFDAEIDIYNYRARYYDPALGRFLSEDPIGFLAGLGNLFGYVRNSPAGLTDPYGLSDTVSIQALYDQGVHALSGAGSINAMLDAKFDLQQRSRKFAAKYKNRMPGNRCGPVSRRQADANENALRHAYWQAAITATHGPVSAEAIGNAHETQIDKFNPRDAGIDRFNNEVGRDIGESVGGENRNPFDRDQVLRNVEQHVLDAYDNGRLDTLVPR